jgi:acetyl-CoA C-acetyltransferase
MTNVVIVAAQRTPIGAFQGAFAPLSSIELGSAAARAVIAKAGIEAREIDQAVMGCVLPAGLGQAPARQAALGAGLPVSVPATTVSKVCGSGLRAIIDAANQIRAGESTTVLAGGFESMTNAPYVLPKARAGLRMGSAELLDHMMYDGLRNAFDGQLMGVFAERTAAKYGFSRTQQDEFAAESARRSQHACAHAFEEEITSVQVSTRKAVVTVTRDEIPDTVDIAKIAQLKSAFAKDGTVTAASSSAIADGAACVLLMDESAALRRGLKPLARIVSYASHAHEPEWFTTAPVGAVRKALQKADWQVQDVDLFEINEAFAVVTMAAMRDLGIAHERTNVNGGACALGHPIGATGARVIVTLLHALRARSARRGVASVCIGGGEALALSLELL